jgi:hypothetical protein
MVASARKSTVKHTWHAIALQRSAELRSVAAIPTDNLIKALESGSQLFAYSGILKPEQVNASGCNRGDLICKLDDWNNRSGNPNLGILGFQTAKYGKRENAVPDSPGPYKQATHSLCLEAVELVGIPAQDHAPDLLSSVCCNLTVPQHAA